MKKTKAYYLSEDIDPIDWESVSDAYNDLHSIIDVAGDDIDSLIDIRS